LAADLLGILKPIKGFFEEKLVIPVRRSFKPAPQDKSCQNFEAENLSLKTQVASLKEEIISTRKLLGAPLPQDWKFLPVKIIGETEEEIIIEGGKNEGIKKEMVAVFEGVFLGKVEKVSEKISKIRLLTDPDSKEVVKIIGKDSLSLAGKGLLLGKGGGKMAVKEILAEEEVGEGDLVVVTVEGFDLPVGKISSVNYKKGEVFKNAEVEQEIKTRNLQTIFLLMGKI
jgi:rod shape-determining protein MreC